MKRLILVLILVITIAAALPVQARQDGTPHRLAYDGFSFSYPDAIGPNVHITRVDMTGQQVQGPIPIAPPHTEIMLLDSDAPPEAGPYMLPPATIRVYRIAEATPPEYQYSMEQIAALQALLAQRPELAAYMDPALPAGSMPLPYLPLINAAQVTRARAKYVDLGTLSGVSYLTTFAQGPSPYTSESFRYTFQGISSDGQYYVAVEVPVQTDIFPPGVPQDFDFDAWMARLTEYNTESITALNTSDPGAFTPSLNMVEQMIMSMAFGG